MTQARSWKFQIDSNLTHLFVSGFLGELGHCILSHTLGLLTADCVNDDDVVLSSLSSTTITPCYYYENQFS